MNPYKYSRSFGEGNNAFEIKQVNVSLASKQVDGFNIDNATNSMKDHYWRLFHILNMAGTNGNRKCPSITFSNFIDNFFCLVYDFTASGNLTDADLMPLIRSA